MLTKPIDRLQLRIAQPTVAVLGCCLSLACTGVISDYGQPPPSQSSAPSGAAGVPGSVVVSPTSTAKSLPTSGLRRLTREQYGNAIRDLFHREPSVDLDLPPDEVTDEGFEFSNVGAQRATTSAQAAQKYDIAASSLAESTFKDPIQRTELVGCSPASPEDACVARFLSSFGRSAFRRPLSSEELGRFSLLVRAGAASFDIWRGLSAATYALLASPSFLYRAELGSPDAGRLKLDDFELATRMAFLFWNTIPDAALLDAAGSGELSTPDGLSKQVDRLLASPRAEQALVGFFTEWLGFRGLGDTPKDPTLFPNFTPRLANAMRGELETFVSKQLLHGTTSVLELYSTQTSYLNSDLAEFYGLSERPGNTFELVTLPSSSHRVGLLSFAGFLAANSRATMTSPTLRGRFVRERLLCGVVPPPPPDVDPTLPAPPAPGVVETMRERLIRHATSPACSGCHQLMDPLGLALEHFDATGAFRERDQGRDLDTTGELDGIAFAGAEDLGRALAQHPEAGRCVVKQLARHALGQDDTPDEAWIFDELSQRFASGGYALKALLTALVSHEAFKFSGGLR